MEASEIIWEEPPPPTLQQRKRGMYADVADELREHPKRWGRIYLGSQGGSSTLAYGIRRSTRTGFREGRWEAISRRVGDDDETGWATYARYLGDDEET
jgi:hypothetical protein